MSYRYLASVFCMIVTKESTQCLRVRQPDMNGTSTELSYQYPTCYMSSFIVKEELISEISFGILYILRDKAF